MNKFEICSKLRELSIKYEDVGLKISFEFNKFEMVLKGWLELDLSSISYDVYKYNRAYSYEMIESMPDEIDIETLVDKFKEEVFEQYKRYKEKNSDRKMDCKNCIYSEMIKYEYDEKTGKTNDVHWCELLNKLCKDIQECQFKIIPVK